MYVVQPLGYSPDRAFEYEPKFFKEREEAEEFAKSLDCNFTILKAKNYGFRPDGEEPIEKDTIEKAEKSHKYRSQLGRHIGKQITLECSEYRLGARNEEGNLYMLLCGPKILKIGNDKPKKDWKIGHLWIQVPADKEYYVERYLQLSRKIKVEGKVQEYNYSLSGKRQVGVKSSNVEILKYKKGFAKQFDLAPGKQLSEETMNHLLDREEFQRVLEEIRGRIEETPEYNQYEVERIRKRNDGRNIDVMVSNWASKFPMFDEGEIRKIVLNNLDKLSDYYAFIKSKNRECVGYGVVKPIDKDSVEIGYELYEKYQGQEIGSACVARFVEHLRGEYKTTKIIAKIDASNIASRRLMEKLDARIIGTEAGEVEELALKIKNEFGIDIEENVDMETDGQSVEVYMLT